jgi:hypothetical protein
VSVSDSDAIEIPGIDDVDLLILNDLVSNRIAEVDARIDWEHLGQLMALKAKIVMAGPAASRSRGLSITAFTIMLGVLIITLGVLISVGSSNHRQDTSKYHSPNLHNPPGTSTEVGPVTTEVAALGYSGTAPLKTVTKQSIPGSTPMPKLYHSDHLLCGQYQICTANEFRATVRDLGSTWNLMPEDYRLQCVSKNTVPDMSNCIVTEQMNFFSKHAGERQDLLEQQNPWLYERDRNGNPIQPPPASIK